MRLLGHYEGIEASVLGKISKDALPWKQKNFERYPAHATSLMDLKSNLNTKPFKTLKSRYEMVGCRYITNPFINKTD